MQVAVAEDEETQALWDGAARRVNAMPGALAEPPERSLAGAGFTGSGDCALVVNDDKYGQACPEYCSNPLAYCS